MYGSRLASRYLLIVLVAAVSSCFLVVFYLTNDDGRHGLKRFTTSYTDQLLLSSNTDCRHGSLFALTTNELCLDAVNSENVEILTNETLSRGLVDFSRLVLIVSFNKPHFESITKAHRLYHNIFHRVIYCVTKMDDLLTFRKGSLWPLVNVSIVEYKRIVTDPPGESFYNCVVVVLDQFPGIEKALVEKRIDGFLQISDDLIPNLWQFKKSAFPLSHTWLIHPHALYDIDRKTFCNRHYWNNDDDCTWPEIWPVLTAYQPLLQATLTKAQILYPEFTHNLSLVSSGYRRVWNGNADIFYVPGDNLLRYKEIFRLFAVHNIYVELAVPTLLLAMSAASNRLLFLPRDGQILGANRSLDVTDTYDASLHYYHPLKLGNIQNATSDRQCLYCALVNAFDRIRYS